jgi:heme-degrading monooxygenase HmoA
VWNGLVLVLHRFRVPEPEAATFRAEIEEALAVLREQRGFDDGTIGRNVDDPELWVLQTRWAGPGAYRRGLSAYDVKVRAWAVLGRAIDEASAYEVIDGGQEPNQARPRGTGVTAPTDGG